MILTIAEFHLAINFFQETGFVDSFKDFKKCFILRENFPKNLWNFFPVSKKLTVIWNFSILLGIFCFYLICFPFCQWEMPHRTSKSLLWREKCLYSPNLNFIFSLESVSLSNISHIIVLSFQYFSRTYVWSALFGLRMLLKIYCNHTYFVCNVFYSLVLF